MDRKAALASMITAVAIEFVWSLALESYMCRPAWDDRPVPILSDFGALFFMTAIMFFANIHEMPGMTGSLRSWLEFWAPFVSYRLMWTPARRLASYVLNRNLGFTTCQTARYVPRVFIMLGALLLVFALYRRLKPSWPSIAHWCRLCSCANNRGPCGRCRVPRCCCVCRPTMQVRLIQRPTPVRRPVQRRVRRR